MHSRLTTITIWSLWKDPEFFFPGFSASNTGQNLLNLSHLAENSCKNMEPYVSVPISCHCMRTKEFHYDLLTMFLKPDWMSDPLYVKSLPRQLTLAATFAYLMKKNGILPQKSNCYFLYQPKSIVIMTLLHFIILLFSSFFLSHYSYISEKHLSFPTRKAPFFKCKSEKRCREKRNVRKPVQYLCHHSVNALCLVL